jgi:hypothetical protein
VCGRPTLRRTQVFEYEDFRMTLALCERGDAPYERRRAGKRRQPAVEIHLAGTVATAARRCERRLHDQTTWQLGRRAGGIGGLDESKPRDGGLDLTVDAHLLDVAMRKTSGVA